MPVNRQIISDHFSLTMTSGSAATGIRTNNVALAKLPLVAVAQPSRSRFMWLWRNQQDNEDRSAKPRTVKSISRTLRVSTSPATCDQTLFVPQGRECCSSLHESCQEKERTVEKSRLLLPFFRIYFFQFSDVPNQSFGNGIAQPVR